MRHLAAAPLTAAISAALSGKAFAHAGEHSELTSLSSALDHVVGSPFHLMLVSVALVSACAFVGYRRFFAGKSSQEK